MEKSKILQIVGPGLAAAAVLLVVGVLIVNSDWAAGPEGKNGAAVSSSKHHYGPGATVSKEDFNAEGMTGTMPNANDSDWKHAADGLEIWDVKEGTGDKACPPSATVTIHYTGWTLNGNTFDSSVSKNQPATFPLDNLIQGWQIGIPGMKLGGIRRLKIPGPLGYGAKGGGGGAIPPNATLIFEIKLLSFS